jgi:hypothetical protein
MDKPRDEQDIRAQIKEELEKSSSSGSEEEEESEIVELQDNKLEVAEEHVKKMNYNKSIVRVSRKLFARYIVISRCVCFAMIWMHLTMAVVSLFATNRANRVKNESDICMFVFTVSHLLYGYIQLGLAMLYFFFLLYITAKTLDSLRNNVWILIFFIGLVIYTMGLKIIADINCTFWGITFMQLALQASQFAFEAFIIKLFFDWVFKKTAHLKQNLEQSIDILAQDKHLEEQFGKSVSKYYA